MHHRHGNTMDAVRSKLKEAIDLQVACQNSLNQTMRECLAKDKIKHLPHEHNCSKGAFSISREVDYDNIKSDNNIDHFVNSKTKVQKYSDMEILKIKSLISDTSKTRELLSLIHQLELTERIVPIGDLKRIEKPPTITQQNKKSGTEEFSVFFPLKEIHGKVNFSRAVFIINNPVEIFLGEENDTSKTYTLLTGEDHENNALFFRWITYCPEEEGDSKVVLKHTIKECVLMFNQSHQFEIKQVISPMSKKESADSVQIKKLYVEQDDETEREKEVKYVSDKLDKNKIQSSTKFNPDNHDPTLFFLLKQYPEKRFIKATSDDTGLVNENDISVFEKHSRTCIRDIASLHWAFSGLCSVLECLEKGSQKGNIAPVLNSIKLPFKQHSEMLYIIAYAARLVTTKFIKSSDNSNYKLENLYSPYNQVLVSASSNGSLDINTIDYIGCKLTQWFISDAENNMEVIAKNDENTRMSEVLKVKLLKVDCNLSRTAIKTTHTTDILISLGRKAYLDPWKLIYPNGHESLPLDLRTYSLKSLPGYAHLNWPVKFDMTDKKISVVLNTKHLIRLTFHTFRRKFNGADPVVASKAVEKAASKPKGKKETSKSRKRVEKLVRPKKISFNDMLRRVNTGDETVSQKFVFGGAQTQTWSWNR
jgi:hypothetical protein